MSVQRQIERSHRLVGGHLAAPRRTELAVPGATPFRAGTASSFIHHGEILQGVFAGEDGRLHRGLMSMPCALYSAQAAYTAAAIPAVIVRPATRVKARRAAEETLAVLGWPCSGGYLDLIGNVPTSRGFGSSTSDVLAAIWAVQDAFGDVLPNELIARIAVRAETASDSLMFGGRSVLFGHREGTIIEAFQHRLPRLRVVGFGTSRSGCGVDTLAMPPAVYTRAEIELFRELRAMLRDALAAADPRLLGSVATASTVINQRHLPMEVFDAVRPLIRRVGAVGMQVAHSGDIAGLIFDGRPPDVATQEDRACALLGELGITDVWRFSVGG